MSIGDVCGGGGGDHRAADEVVARGVRSMSGCAQPSWPISPRKIGRGHCVKLDGDADDHVVGRGS